MFKNSLEPPTKIELEKNKESEGHAEIHPCL